jgi:glycosyltransferase involved in cell wall biosynthesis
MNNPKIAILICAFNEENYLPAALDALNNQTTSRGDYDVVVVDNASTDRTAQIIEEKGAIRVAESKKGIVNALKAGFDYMNKNQVDWVLCTDADSEAPREWVEVVVNAIKQNPDAGFTGPVFFTKTPWLMNQVSGLVYKGVLVMSKLIGGFVQFIGSNMAIKMSDYNRIGGLDMKYKISADVDISRRLTRVGGRIVYVPKMKMYVSNRRFRKEPLRATIQYIQ